MKDLFNREGKCAYETMLELTKGCTKGSGTYAVGTQTIVRTDVLQTDNKII